MIRVNLAKTHSYQPTGTQTAIAMDQAAISAAAGAHPAAKVACMVAFVILLYIYESYNLSAIQSQFAQRQAALQQIQNEVQEFGSVTNVVADLQKEKKQLDTKLAVIQKISQKRAFKLKAIQFIQESVLDDLWLKSLTVSNNTLEISGFSITPTSVQQIVKTLSAADFVEPGVTQEIKRIERNETDINTFKITAQVKQ